MGKDWSVQGFFKKDDNAGNKQRIAALDGHLKHQMRSLDELQNFADEVFTSVANQSSDVVSAVFIMKGVNNGAYFYASMAVLGTNAVVRLGIGLATVCSGDVRVKSCGRVLLGLVWGMIEPVSGNAILASGVRARVPDIATVRVLGGSSYNHRKHASTRLFGSIPLTSFLLSYFLYTFHSSHVIKIK